VDDLRHRNTSSSEASPADLSSSVADLARCFPGVMVWFGECTRHFWAMVGDRLVEALTAEELAHKMTGMPAADRRESR
jgi:hypothetical protein